MGTILSSSRDTLPVCVKRGTDEEKISIEHKKECTSCEQNIVNDDVPSIILTCDNCGKDDSDVRIHATNKVLQCRM